MKALRVSLLAMLVLIVISACAPDPRKEAQAYATRSEADQSALTQEQQRQQSQDLHAIDMQQKQLEQQHREATAQRWEAAMNSIIKWFGWAGSVAVFMAVIAMAITFSRTSLGVGEAMVRAANVRANLIQLNPTTRQFPLLIQHVHGNKYALHNPNLGSVVMLDAGKDADRQLIATAGATQIAGVLATEARRSSDPAGVAMVNVPIVDAKDDQLLIGRDFLKDVAQLNAGESNE
jgi:hypothetical protein